MKHLFILPMLLAAASASAQLEFSTGIAANQHDGFGAPVHAAYEFKLKGRWFTKSQLGYKFLHSYNDYVDATLKIYSWEFHQTVSYELIRKKNFIFKPNLGLNYRIYHWKGKMNPPYNTVPQRAWVIGTREGNFVLDSYDNGYSRDLWMHNPGFSIQLQAQFRLSDKIWLHLTPFMEPDYDRSENTGGAYAGIVFKAL